ncbi:MAG: MerR family transcriptional regulator [Clostridia bacterium]|nr:MerR family transcriptional regulator [Clostridia bacterium]
MRLSIGEAAGILGVSVRTLRWYDQIGLVSPAEVGENGYRYYDREALALLQQALFYKELGLPLKEIKPLLQAPETERRRALLSHRALLELKKQQLEGLLQLVDDTLGGTPMSKPIITQADIDAAKEQYAQEAKERWGHTDAWKQAEGKTPDAAGMEDIFRGFAALREGDPASPEAQTQVAAWQAFITDNLYTCTREILAGLGQMYVCDERFTRNLDKYGEGTAAFMAEAIKIYCK